MIQALAIDCCWLVNLDADLPEARFMDRLRILTAMVQSDTHLLLDVGNHIRGEYERNVKGLVGRKFLQTLILAGRVGYHHGGCTEAENQALDAIGFDHSDRPYLAVAGRSGAGLFLTDEEKHLNSAQRAAVVAACGVQILSTNDLLGL